MKKKAGILNEVDWKRLREEITPIIEEAVERKIEETKPAWLQEMNERIKKHIEEVRPKWVDSMLSAGDKAAGYFKKFDEEKTVLAGQVEDLDERVRKIEEKFGFPQPS